jgi:hypothetical protein
MLAFDNMADRLIRGTTDWEHHEVVLDVLVQAQIALGVLLVGEGEAWMSDFNVEIVGPEVQTTGSGGGAGPTSKPRLVPTVDPEALTAGPEKRRTPRSLRCRRIRRQAAVRTPFRSQHCPGHRSSLDRIELQ